MRDAAADLFLGSRCVGCERPGRLLCPVCRTAMTRPPEQTWPDPVPDGLVEPWAAAPYEGVVRSAVLGHKEDGLWALGRPLGVLLAEAVVAGLTGLAEAPVLLVPIPSRPAVVRQRGHAPTLALSRAAGRVLRQAGVQTHVLPVLRLGAAVADQSGLSATERADNLAGSLWCPGGPLRRSARRHRRGWVVLCDDVMTTGATLREGQRALAAVGLDPVIAAVVAATRRRTQGPRPAAEGAGRPVRAGPAEFPLPPVADSG